MCRKDDIFRQRQLNHRERGEGDYGTQSHAAEPYSCLQVWVFIKVNIHHEYDLIWKDSLHAGFYFWKNVTVSKEARKMSIFVHSFFLLLWLTFPPLLAQITSFRHSSWPPTHISSRRRKCEPEEEEIWGQGGGNMNRHKRHLLRSHHVYGAYAL